MGRAIESLLVNLSSRGLSEHEIPWFVRDVLYALNRSGAAPLERVDRELSELGWDRSLLDEHLLELIFHLVKEDVEQAPRGSHGSE